jgi:hypothetical protein
MLPPYADDYGARGCCAVGQWCEVLLGNRLSVPSAWSRHSGGAHILYRAGQQPRWEVCKVAIERTTRTGGELIHGAPAKLTGSSTFASVSQASPAGRSAWRAQPRVRSLVGSIVTTATSSWNSGESAVPSPGRQLAPPTYKILSTSTQNDTRSSLTAQMTAACTGHASIRRWLAESAYSSPSTTLQTACATVSVLAATVRCMSRASTGGARAQARGRVVFVFFTKCLAIRRTSEGADSPRVDGQRCAVHVRRAARRCERGHAGMGE